MTNSSSPHAFSSTVIGIAIALSAGVSPALAAAPLEQFNLPFCPAVKESEKPALQKLAPIKLDSDNDQTSPTPNKESGTADSSSLRNVTEKSETQRNVPNTFENAQKANCVPLSLMPSSSETIESRQLSIDSQQKQMADLWAATIERSQDIQFVVKVLQPQTDQKHAVAKALNMVGGVLYNAASLATPGSPAARAAIGSIGQPSLEKLFKQVDKAPQISVGETIVLYKMVRDTADSVIDSYRYYRIYGAERDAARIDLEDLELQRESMLKDSKEIAGQFEYTLKKAQREALLSEERVELYRQKLLEFAGGEAIDHLDGQIAEERAALANLIGRPDIKPVLNAPKSQSASAAPYQNPTNVKR